MTRSTRPVALLHGWGGTYAATYRAAGWEAYLRQHGLEPIGIDLPGHALEGASHDPADYHDMAADVAKRVPADVRHCIAFSLGAKIALAIAVRSPGRFDKLVLGGVGDNLFAPETVGAALAESLLGNRDPEDCPDVVRTLLAYIEKGGADKRALAAVVRRPHNPVHTPLRLKEVLADILVVNGDRDMVALPDHEFLAALPQAQRLILKDCDHVGLTDDRRFLDAAAQFLRS